MDRRALRTIIFDLGEVLIGGLYGIEAPLARRLTLPKDAILHAFSGAPLKAFCQGQITENTYLQDILAHQGWRLPLGELKEIVRTNLRRRVPGMEPILSRLEREYQLILHSDHAREWITYVRTVHPFLKRFDRTFFSFELGYTKDESVAFRKVLVAIGRAPEECLFIDDKEINVQVASSIGISTIRFLSARRLSDALNRLGI